MHDTPATVEIVLIIEYGRIQPKLLPYASQGSTVLCNFCVFFLSYLLQWVGKHLPPKSGLLLHRSEAIPHRVHVAIPEPLTNGCHQPICMVDIIRGKYLPRIIRT
jgi:hypothetical protein